MSKPVQASTYTFRDIIEGGFLYVDKTPYLYELIRYNKGIYFLSRPRRFGKSLMIATLEEIFRGNKQLFRGLWLYESDYSWQPHPVIHQTIFYLIFLLLGVHVMAEVKTNRGRIDSVIELADRIYLSEFKLTGSAVTALKQIKNNEYYQKYRLKGKMMILVGAKFDRKKRKVTDWKAENQLPI